jgi:sugar phosphate isomerase/epimerase
MKIGINTDSLALLSLDEVLDTAAGLGIDCVEMSTGNWSTAPHVILDELVESESARRELLARVRDRGLEISALNCSGNPLHPGPTGKEHDEVTHKTIALAPKLGVERVVMMSGCPAAPGDSHPNWITVAWPPEAVDVLEWQWSDVLIPYWQELVRYASDHGVVKLCLELHGHQNVYNVPTLLRLREAVGPVVGANYDPSHLMWMGADPIAAIEALGDAIYHVHAKDTRIEKTAALTSRLETRLFNDPDRRSWNFVTLGYGHDDAFWRAFCVALRRAGYDDVLSIEHEDMLMTPLEGVTKTVDFLRGVMIRDPAALSATAARFAGLDG